MFSRGQCSHHKPKGAGRGHSGTSVWKLTSEVWSADDTNWTALVLMNLKLLVILKTFLRLSERMSATWLHASDVDNRWGWKPAITRNNISNKEFNRLKVHRMCIKVTALNLHIKLSIRNEARLHQISFYTHTLWEVLPFTRGQCLSTGNASLNSRSVNVCSLRRSKRRSVLDIYTGAFQVVARQLSEFQIAWIQYTATSLQFRSFQGYLKICMISLSMRSR